MAKVNAVGDGGKAPVAKAACADVCEHEDTNKVKAVKADTYAKTKLKKKNAKSKEAKKKKTKGKKKKKKKTGTANKGKQSASNPTIPWQ